MKAFIRISKSFICCNYCFSIGIYNFCTGV